MDPTKQPKLRLHDKHISLNITEHVSAICAPLFSKTDISYFHYGRVYPSGYSLVLISHPEFHKFFWSKEYDKVVFSGYEEGIFINKCENQILRDARDYFNVDYWLMINKDKNEFIESFGFGTYAGNDKIINYYLNNQEVLEQFGLYFKEQAKELIALSEKSLLYTEGLEVGKNTLESSKGVLKDFLIDKKYLIENSAQAIVKITKIEFTILHYLSLGLSAKEIGKRMSLSFRTIECHILKIKTKLLAKNKADLIARYRSLFKERNPSFEFIEHIFTDIEKIF